ncbi:enoyl-CoA hydratase/isomerase family protein [Streptomyces sp. NPDC013161]|uniref:enoyl-CoA hydratase/isomerase family protein n=1 Tax=Streptomyces sp. NPDC013161 TaxID=3364862 RepID=UPI0036C4FC8C
MLSELLEVLRSLEEGPSVRVMILSGAGDHFCQGGDRSEFPALLKKDPSGFELRALPDRARRVCSGLSQLGLVTIARLHGDVMSAGLGLAAYCDLRVGADTCRFRMPEIGLGVPPAWGGVLPRLAEEAGQAWVRRLLLTAESFDAARAELLSILHEVVPLEDLDGAVARWAGPIARRDPTTVRITKQMLNARWRYRPPGRFGIRRRTADIRTCQEETAPAVTRARPGRAGCPGRYSRVAPRLCVASVPCQCSRIAETFLCSLPLTEAGPSLEAAHAV